MLGKHLELPPPKISYNGNCCSFLENKWNTLTLAQLLQHGFKINLGALAVSLEAGCLILKTTVHTVRPLVSAGSSQGELEQGHFLAPVCLPYFFPILFLFSIFDCNFRHPLPFFVQRTLNATGFSVLGLIPSWKAAIWEC